MVSAFFISALKTQRLGKDFGFFKPACILGAVSQFSCQAGRTLDISTATQKTTLPAACTQHCSQKPV